MCGRPSGWVCWGRAPSDMGDVRQALQVGGRQAHHGRQGGPMIDQSLIALGTVWMTLTPTTPHTQAVLRAWLPLSEAVLGMAVAQLPGPAAASYRMPRLLGVPAPAQLGALEGV